MLMKILYRRIQYYIKLLVSDIGSFLITKRKPVCQKLGNKGADWWIPIGVIDRNFICYSGGVGDNISFDLELIKKCKVNIFAFDPTPRSAAFIKKLPKNKKKNFNFYPVGLWKNNTKQKFFFPKNKAHISHSIVNLQKTNEYFMADCKTIKKIMNQLGHKTIDLLKIDIEGAEYSVLSKMLDDKVFPKILCVEFDQPAKIMKMYSMIVRLLNEGYYLIKKDYFNFTFYKK